jgi:modulator of FtsH protease
MGSMSTFSTGEATRARSVSTAAILGQVLFLVAVALAFCVAGTFMGRELDTGVARACSFAGLGMLIAQSFVSKLRYGSVGIGWLCVTALLIGLGLGPVIAYASEVQPGAITSAAGITALTVLGMGALSMAITKDLAAWMRPLSLIVLAAVGVSLFALMFGGLGTLSPFVSLIILAVSSLLILVNFQYVRMHATEDDVVWLATGIFVSVVNIFISLLNLFLSD